MKQSTQRGSVGKLLWYEPYAYQLRRRPQLRKPPFRLLLPGLFKLVLGAGSVTLIIGLLARVVVAGVPSSTVFWFLLHAWLLVAAGLCILLFAGCIAVVLLPAAVHLHEDGISLEKPAALVRFAEIGRVAIVFPVSGDGTMELTTGSGVRTVGVPAGADLADLERALGQKLVVKTIIGSDDNAASR